MLRPIGAAIISEIPCKYLVFLFVISNLVVLRWIYKSYKAKFSKEFNTAQVIFMQIPYDFTTAKTVAK